MAAPRIVVLDGHALNPGDLDWSPLAALGELSVHARSEPERVVERARAAPIVLTNKTRLDAAVIAALPELRYIGVLATGYDVVDVAAARARGIIVSNVPAYAPASVAQHVFALVLQLATHVAEHAAAVTRGDWQRSPDYSFTVAPITELSGKTLGIVGMGAIGRRVASIGHALGMRVAAAEHPRHPEPPGVDVTWLPLDALCAEADVLSLHCPLTDATCGLMDERRLALMKATAIIVNTSRGALIDEPALRAALDRGTIAGAGLDVLSAEPPVAGNVLIGAPRCVITPHVAWASVDSRRRLLDGSIENVRAFLADTPRNVVS